MLLVGIRTFFGLCALSCKRLCALSSVGFLGPRIGFQLWYSFIPTLAVQEDELAAESIESAAERAANLDAKLRSDNALS